MLGRSSLETDSIEPQFTISTLVVVLLYKFVEAKIATLKIAQDDINSQNDIFN